MDEKRKVELFRNRFYGRQDLYGRKWYMQDETQTRSGYAPVCEHHWKDFCHRKLKDGVQCSQCSNRSWAPVTEDSVLKHIRGEEEHIFYVLQTDGTIKFGAIDFDMKPGKEDIGHTFEDVVRVSKLISSYGIAHYIARSTTHGYHLYFFFEEFYSANKFRCFISEIFERVGFKEELRLSGKPLPEYFPKQAYAGKDGVGNGIKPPMIEPQFPKGRNCFVGPDDSVIEDQWTYLDNTSQISSLVFDKMLEDQDIPIIEDKFAPSSNGAAPVGSFTDRLPTKWQPPVRGSIEKVLEGCAAFRKIKDKIEKKEVLGHKEGFSLFHICIHTQDGRDWFKSHVKGWGDTDKDLKQLEHSVDKNYAPWTCRKLQEEGICVPGTQCFEKKPPREIVDGLEVYRDDLPKEKWPEPSPIRYAHGRGEDFLLKLQKEVEALKTMEDASTKMAKLKEVVDRIQVFDIPQQKEFKAFVRGLKLLKTTEISKIFNEATAVHEEESKKQLQGRTDVVMFDDNFYMRADPAGYVFMKTTKEGKKKAVRLCSFDVVIEEERNYIEEDKPVLTAYKGKVRMPGFEKAFDIPVDAWHDNTQFITYFGKLIGSHFCPLRSNLEYIRQAVTGFSRKAGIDRQVYLMTQGFHGDTYLMPSCLVDSTGVRPNTSNHVDLRYKETRNLDFKILGVEELKEILSHIRTDFLNCWPELWTYTGIAHTLLPGIMSPMGWTKRPTLFYEGLTGGGKSELTHALQFFWGKFDSIANFFSSAKGIRELGYQFKDACVVVDDYKGLSREQVSTVKECILRSYDGSSEFKLNINTELRTPKATRGLYMMSGEEFITSDAATVARTVLVITNKHNTQETQNKYASVRKHRINYSGITPAFICWFLKQDRLPIEKRFEACRLRLREGYHNAQNIDRIAANLAMNYTVWELFTAFMLESGVASLVEKEVMNDKHWGHILLMRADMLNRCASEQSSEIFIRVLAELIMTEAVMIDNMRGITPDTKKPLVGFIPKEGPPGTICFFPKIVYETVKNYCKNQPITGSDKAIIRQLDDQGAVAEKDHSRYTRLMRYNGTQCRVWSLKMSSLGLLPDNMQDVPPTKEDDSEGGKLFKFPGSIALPD